MLNIQLKRSEEKNTFLQSQTFVYLSMYIYDMFPCSCLFLLLFTIYFLVMINYGFLSDFRSVRYIPFPGRRDLSLYARLAGKPLVMAPTTYEGVVTVDVAGRVRLWETGLSNLVQSLEKWKGLIGEDYQGPLQVWSFLSEKQSMCQLNFEVNEICCVSNAG